MGKKVLEEDIGKVKVLIGQVFGKYDYKTIERLGGLTNHTYKVGLEDGKAYIIRIPGEGTEEMINRTDEEIRTKLACDLGIDARLYYFGKDGSKVTEYITDSITMSSDLLKQTKHIEQMAEIFHKLHNCGQDTGVPFEVFDMAVGYEKIIKNHNVFMYDDYQEVKNKVMGIKKEIDELIDIKKVPCHNDALCENWVEGDGKMYLIDWEYAGMNDGMWDLADVSIEASYDKCKEEELLTAYMGKKPDVMTWKHFYANKIYVDYLWTLWAKTRVPFDGQSMEDWATERYNRLKETIATIENM
ncbi:MAG: phosphotransferase [Lachnospiraceae bacterium]